MPFTTIPAHPRNYGEFARGLLSDRLFRIDQAITRREQMLAAPKSTITTDEESAAIRAVHQAAIERLTRDRAAVLAEIAPAQEVAA